MLPQSCGDGMAMLARAPVALITENLGCSEFLGGDAFHTARRPSAVTATALVEAWSIARDATPPAISLTMACTARSCN